MSEVKTRLIITVVGYIVCSVNGDKRRVFRVLVLVLWITRRLAR